MVPFDINGKEDRWDAHGVPVNGHGEENEKIRRWDMGNAGERRHTRGSGNPVGWDLNRATECNRGAVGGATSLILGVCKGDRV